jgi:non-ribosomal peptide synthetase component F
MRSHGPKLSLKSTSRVLRFAAYTFDISIGEIFTTLTYGGCVCVPSEAERMDDLAGVIESLNINWAVLTPTVLSLLPAERLRSLETLVISGEAGTNILVDIWGGKVELLNAYGPAECTIWSAVGRLTPGMSATSIGRGTGSVLWIVDPNNHDQLCPVGAIGELLIEGPIVSKGYLKDEEKTSSTFIVGPPWLQHIQGGDRRRLYKSGDLARYHDDGTIEYLGRKDSQTKINGQRVELGEIEYSIKNALPALQHVSVDKLHIAGSSNQERLVAILE